MDLSDPAFVIFALLAEEEAHGYKVQSVVRERGFRFWTDLGRTSIYNTLAWLERQGLVSARSESASGPARKVYSPTRKGHQVLRENARRRLSRPAHPRNEIDLGLYGLPWLGEEGLKALDESVAYLEQRATFLGERLTWCRAREMHLPALAFERPLVALRAELDWLRRLRDVVRDAPQRLRVQDWQRYEYLEPPDVDA